MANELLSTNIDGLFEKMNLDETQQVLRRMRQEVEKKREELRITVGNRYRDLIEAADTISEMKRTSEDVMDHLMTMENLLSSLKHRQLLGFKTEHNTPERNREVTEAKREYRMLAAQIRLLMELPELIWKLLEAHNYCNAAQVQQLGFHLYVGLSVESGSYGSGINVQKWFPVVKRQKVALTSFNDIIIKESEDQLRAVQLDFEKACDSCCALILQRGDDSLKIMEHFFRLRTEAMRSISQQQGPVKQQVNAYLQCITTSLISLHALFVEGFPGTELPQSQLSEKLKTICRSNAISSTELFQLSSVIKHLPPIISEFKPSINEAWNSLPISTIRRECQNWFETVRQLVPDEMDRLLVCLSQIKALAALRDSAYSTMQTLPYAAYWVELSQRLLGSKVCLWDELLRPGINRKIESLIQGHLDKALESVEQSIMQQNQNRFDLKPWIWTEVASDLPQSITALPNSSGVYMKTRCYTPAVQQLCGQFDSKLAQLWEDLTPYQEGKADDATLVSSIKPFDRFEHRAQVFTALDTRCGDSIRKLVNFLNNKITDRDSRVVFAAKLVSALADLCPNLRRCVNHSQMSSDGKSWANLTDFMRSASLEMFQKWMLEVTAEFEKQLERQLQMSNFADTLKYTPIWDEIQIQEEGEGGNAVQSQIRVPMNPSFSLQQSLFKLCQDINQIGPHAIPKKAQVSFMDHTGSVVLIGYQNYLNRYPGTIPQAVALQLLFDVRFVSALLQSRDNKGFQEKAKNLCESLEGRVDPFDLAVFNPHIQRHVIRAVQSLQFVFGPLLTCDRHAILWAARAANPALTVQPDSPSVVALVSSLPRFLPLPIVNQSRTGPDWNVTSKLIENAKDDVPAQKKPVKNNKTDVPSLTPMAAASAARSSAVAFFGAMSSSWGSSIFGSDK